jgi:hypothetical protein
MRYTILFALVLLSASASQAQTRAHAEASITIDLDAAPVTVLPLFGPVREAEWAHGWSPAMLYPTDRRQLAGSIFTTGQHGTDIVWILARFDEPTLEVEYVQVLPKVWAGQILIRLKPVGPGRTQATVTYKRTALSPEADHGVEAFASHFSQQRDHWQNAINERLRALSGKHDR